ncbi:MAG: spermidine synthase, partial [Bryobacteraceae bacterium]
MIEQDTVGESAPVALNRFLPSLLLLFVGSGCAALIYEIVWYQLLELVIGSSAISLGVLLATFMGGLCLGSLLLPRLVSPNWHPLRVYGLLELGIAICGVLILYGVPYVGRLYAAAVGYGLTGLLLRGLVCAACLLAPTILMGATLPAIARWVETTPRGVSWLGFFYGGNTAGAVAGCLVAGFYLLRVHDMAVATWSAVAINVAVALLGLALSRLAPHSTPPTHPEPESCRASGGSWTIYLAIALSGLTALGAEVIWTRQLSLMLGATVYTFSIILAVFLLGIGLGSGAGSLWARDFQRPRLALGLCQLGLAGAIAWTAFMIARSLPFWPINPSLTSDPWTIFQVDLVRCLWAALPPAFLWGASFPLALAAVAARGQDPGRLVGRVYASNTVGAILGALLVSVLFIPRLGTQGSQRVLIAIVAFSALLALTGWLLTLTPALRLACAALLVASMGVVGLLARSVAGLPWQVVAYGRQSLTSTGSSRILYTGEGMNASVAVTQWPDGRNLFHVSGKVEASTEPHDMRLQRMLGHFPALLHPNPRTVLVVGFGAGVTAGSFVLYPSVEKIVICEIEPLIPLAAARFFARENYNVNLDRRVQIVYDDARHY